MLYAKARDFTKKIKPLRDEIKIAKSALERISYLDDLTKTEMAVEGIKVNQKQNRNWER